MEWKNKIKDMFNRPPKETRMLKDGECYTYENYVFKVRGDCEYDINNPSSISYYWLVDLKNDMIYNNSSFGLPTNRAIELKHTNKRELLKAKNLYLSKQPSFRNIERLITESKTKLDEAMEMLNKLRNGQQG